MQVHTVSDHGERFDVAVWQGPSTGPVVLFAVGAGGQPSRYATLLETLASSGCTVIAPCFERLATPEPTEQELSLRARRLSQALELVARPDMQVLGLGHSIGAATLVAMAGGHMWLRCGRRIDIARDDRVIHLALLAPPTGFFRAPGALDAVHVPIHLWTGSADTITPMEQTQWLAQAVGELAQVHPVAGAGHFSFMDHIPPHATEPLADKATFLRSFAAELTQHLWRYAHSPEPARPAESLNLPAARC
ncbi:alpha/beta hydrolase [Acidovorax sp. DW039]|uniref:alpha/beta hydrolase family protein n=1 Tax=Acidovorax sp. DW039 TaxID=3095606 RepID=UPI003088EFD4|nr:alpha/beta hydrolase [Acidovorax sp. DW039]